MGEKPMPLASHIIALFDTLTIDDIEALPPAHLRRFSALCSHWHVLAERQLPQPRLGPRRNGERISDGVLHELRRRERNE
jgi:hypothetical protein